MVNFTATRLVALLLISVVSGIFLEDMYPYPHNGIAGAEDQLLGPTLDGSSPVIDFNFTFFNSSYDTIYVNNNGHLSFTGQYGQYIPQPFPNTVPLIALFWMDVDTGTTGEVWYKLTNDSALLTRAKADIANYYDNQTTFQPTDVFTATWLDVPYWLAAGDDATKRNTFQVILVSDGIKSFAMFHYQTIEWAGYANGSTKAMVGFNAGDNVTSYTLNNSNYDDIINLEYRSNIGVPGKFIFRVDGNSNIRGW
ncbi:sushi, nidogen and EGF-like domain-containing protein 1 [Pecten maximus]|uniref:sushi, nidogen and EGF-like domain-containing protein 1 n=1 Tax=Pecten maximus TaxID=6579 RepID=UPI001458A8E7|nr:sushi, nidogen and EGF-like domain-containing protein 1 [Pecten maximus]XP_033763882.1 sushi, nidogen and EGF-like domain-containing protein 1 [Pecten maximus]XP_033763883.1 sushi, nidogen and EGF-like domain-containing protein 1 [Pecten maximus]XP_033763884.1 sushi, nidogen and EGF-like domain-containing protein 1 [Pecten maximus]